MRKIIHLSACLEVVLWRRKLLILGSHKAIFEVHSSAMERKSGKVRFPKRQFAAQMTTSKQALKQSGLLSPYFRMKREAHCG